MSEISLRDFKMISSILRSSFLSAAFLLTISPFLNSNWGFSIATIYANIYSSSPDGVIAKFIIVTLTLVSGEYTGLLIVVVKKILNLSS
jgi:hypothetical protein